MKKNEFVMLCLKIMGVYFFLMGLINLPHLMSCLTEPKMSRWDFFVSPLLFFVFGIILFLFAHSFTQFIVDVKEGKEAKIQFSPTHNTTRIALQVLGFYILAQGIPGFFQILANAVLYYYEISTIPEYLRQEQQHVIYLLGPLIKICLGLWFILGSKGIVYLLQSLNSRIDRIRSSNKGVE